VLAWKLGVKDMGNVQSVRNIITKEERKVFAENKKW